MIHAFAVEPRVAATWARREEFRFIHDKFGLGTPRVLLELPVFSSWKRAVYEAATTLGLSAEDMKRIEELFRLFSEHRHRRTNSVYEGVRTWLENAEQEYARLPYGGIIAAQNPRMHEAVLIADRIGPESARWVLENGASPSRSPAAIALALSAMLTNCRHLHLVDPHFGPENARHRKVLEALMDVLGNAKVSLATIRIHCSAKADRAAFEDAATRMAKRLPTGTSIDFVRWQQKEGGERLHNRYVLTDVGGVSLGVGLDEGPPSQTEDVLLLTRSLYALRWRQYADENGAFDCVDRPRAIVGSRRGGPRSR